MTIHAERAPPDQTWSHPAQIEIVSLFIALKEVEVLSGNDVIINSVHCTVDILTQLLLARFPAENIQDVVTCNNREKKLECNCGLFGGCYKYCYFVWTFAIKYCPQHYTLKPVSFPSSKQWHGFLEWAVLQRWMIGLSSFCV